MDRLTKRQIRNIAALQQAGTRRDRNRFLIEGTLCVEEALHVGFPVESVFLTPEYRESESGKLIWETCRRNLVHIEEVSSGDLRRMSSQDHPQGVLAVGKCQEVSGDWIDSGEGILLVIPQLSDPGNLGTILRTAHAFDIRSIWIGDGTVDPWNPKVVRGSMGSLFHLRLHRTANLVNELKVLRTKEIQIYALDSNGDTPVSEILPRPGKIALVVGHEAEGIPNDLIALCDKRVLLGRPGAGVGSLNVAVAAGIVMYLLRQ
jgi:TrmH family RNA methyltransferase